MEKISLSSEETKKIGQEIGTMLVSGAILCLRGELGTGKTTLVKGIAEGLGITEEITSPTFTLMNIYQIKATSYQLQTTNFVHIDTYRLKDEAGLIEIGVEEYLGQPGVITIVEWPEKILGLLKNKKIITIELEHLENDRRLIKIKG